MRLASFRDGERATWGMVSPAGVQLAPPALQSRYPGLRDALAAGAPPKLAAVLTPEFAGAPLRDPASLSFAPLIPDPAHIICVGINYLDHIREMGREPPAKPTLFTRFSDSLVGHGEPLRRPRISAEYDFEGELAIVIGRDARYVSADRALDCVAGYTIFFDGSVRDWQYHTSQFAPGKNFPATGSVGPWLVTADEIPDPSRLHLTTRINGEVMQSAPTADLCFNVSRIIEYVSGFCQLRPGDLIATGTPSGVGYARTPPRWLVAGDRVEVEISGIGILSNQVVDED